MAKIKFFDDRMQSALLGGKMPKTKITPVSSAPTTPLGALDRLGRAGLSTYEKYLEKQKAEAGRKEAFDMLKAFTSGVNKPGKEIPGARITENDQEKADQIVHQKILQDYVSGNWAPGYGDLFVEPKEVENREKAVNDQLNEEKFHIQIDNEIQAITNNGESFNDWAYSIARQHGKNPNSALSVSKDKKQIDALIKDYGEASSKRSINATATTPGLLSLKNYNALKSTNEMRNLHRESLPNPDTTFGPAVVLKGMDAVNTINPKTSGGREMLAALMMKDWQRKEAEAARDEERVYQKNLAEANLRREKDLKGASGWEKTKNFVPGRDVPYSEKVEKQLIKIAKNKKKSVLGGPTSNMRDFAYLQMLERKYPPDDKGRDSAEVANFKNFVVTAQYRDTGNEIVRMSPHISRVKKTVPREKTAKHASIVEGSKKAAALSMKVAGEAWESLGKVTKNIENINDAIAAIDDGAQSGPIEKFLPSIRAASVELDNIQNRMGLDVIGTVTFGALSKGELDLALNTAIPMGLKPPELRKWLVEKRSAQAKLSKYLSSAAIYLGKPGNTVFKWAEMQESKRAAGDPGVKTVLPEGVTEADIVKTMKEHNMTRKQVLEKLRRLRNGG